MIICFFDNAQTFSTVFSHLKDSTELAVIFDKGASASLAEVLPHTATAVVSSEDENMLTALSRLGVTTITCGGAKDTVTYSSNSEEGIVVSVQRKINDTEAFELPLKKENRDSEYGLMALAAIKALLGEV